MPLLQSSTAVWEKRKIGEQRIEKRRMEKGVAFRRNIGCFCTRMGKWVRFCPGENAASRRFFRRKKRLTKRFENQRLRREFGWEWGFRIRMWAKDVGAKVEKKFLTNEVLFNRSCCLRRDTTGWQNNLGYLLILCTARENTANTERHRFPQKIILSKAWLLCVPQNTLPKFVKSVPFGVGGVL